MSPDVDLDKLAKEEVVDFICEATTSADDTPSFSNEKREFIENVFVYVRLNYRLSCHTRITSMMCLTFLRFLVWNLMYLSRLFESLCKMVGIGNSLFLFR